MAKGQHFNLRPKIVGSVYGAKTLEFNAQLIQHYSIFQGFLKIALEN